MFSLWISDIHPDNLEEYNAKAVFNDLIAKKMHIMSSHVKKINMQNQKILTEGNLLEKYKWVIAKL